MNKQNRKRFIDTKNILMVDCWEGVGGLSIKSEGIEKYRLVMGKYRMVTE